MTLNEFKTLAILTAGLMYMSSAAAQTPAQTQVLRKFAEDVCLKTLTGNDKRVVRYTASPAISLYNDADATASTVFDAAVGDLNDALKQVPFALSVSAPQSSSAPVRVIYCPSAKFVITCKNHGVTPEGNRDWISWYWWDGQHRITRSLAVISYDSSSAKKVQRTTRQALMFALGFSGFSTQPVPSVLSTAAEQSAEKLTTYDRSLLLFFQTALQPGDKPFEVRRAFDKSWK